MPPRSHRDKRTPRVIRIGDAPPPSDARIVKVEPDGGLTEEQEKAEEERKKADLIALMKSRIEVMDKQKAVARKPLGKGKVAAIDLVAKHSAELQMLAEEKNLSKTELHELMLKQTEYIDAGSKVKMSAAQRKKADRNLEASHQAKLTAVRNRMRAAGMNEDEVARVELYDVLREENMAAGLGAAVIMTKKEQAAYNARQRLKHLADTAEVCSQMEADTRSLIRKAMKYGSRPKHEIKDEAYKVRRLKQLMGEAVEEEMDEEFIPDATVIETREQREQMLKKKLRQLQVEWETAALKENKKKLTPQKAVELIDAHVAQLRVERLARFEQLVQFHSNIFFAVMRGRFVDGIADLDHRDEVINKDPASWRKEVRAFLDITVPVESLLDFSFGWQTRGDVVTRTIEQAAVYLKQAENRAVYDPERGAIHKHHAEELLERIRTYDPENEFVFCLTVRHDPGRKGQLATESFMSGTVHRDAFTHREDIAKAGLSKRGFTEPPPICANPECQAFCVSRERCKREYLPKCVNGEHCTSKGYVFCSPACLTKHRETRHSESEEAKRAQEKREKEQAEVQRIDKQKEMERRKLRREIEAERGTLVDPRPVKLTVGEDGTVKETFFNEDEERVKRDLYRGFGFTLDAASEWLFDPNERVHLTRAQKELSKRVADQVAKRRRALAVAAAAGLETVASIEEIDHKRDA